MVRSVYLASVSNPAADLRQTRGVFTIARIIMRCFTARLLFKRRSANLPNGEARKVNYRRPFHYTGYAIYIYRERKSYSETLNINTEVVNANKL